MGFDAHDVAREIVIEVRAILGRVRVHDADLAKQLKRAAQSTFLNIGEGNRRVGGDKLHHFTVAAGSAGEVLDAVENAELWGYVDRASTADVRALLDRELAMLWRLTHPRA